MSKTNTTKPKTTPAPADTPPPAGGNNWISADNLLQLLDDLENLFDTMNIDMLTTALTTAQRRRLQGSGVRRYGFIDKTSDVSEEFPQFAPPYFNTNTLKIKLREIEIVRNLLTMLQAMSRIGSDVLLLLSDEAFQMALAYYNSVGEAARRRQPSAEAVFKVLQLYFRRRSSQTEEPTEPEVERDLRALLHGRKEGKIVIENERPHMTGGKRVVVDETHKARAAWKATEEGEISE